MLADQLGVDVIALGEHHRPEYSISTPETVLAGIATRTSRIRLGSGVTVLSSDDPVRVFQRFATVDALSNGRAEVILGRGSFTESFPLFGYDLRRLRRAVRGEDRAVRASCSTRSRSPGAAPRAPPLENADVFPKTESGRLTTWVGVGGSPQSVVRTAQLRAAAHARHHRRRARALRAATSTCTGGRPSSSARPRTRSACTRRASSPTPTRRPSELFWPRYKVMRDRIGALRGWPPIRREEFDAEVEHGSLYVGSPETVARKIARAVRRLGVGRFDLIYTAGRAAGQRPAARRRAVRHAR